MTDSGAPGRLITVEGIDGAGKSTHLSRIEAQMRDAGIDVVSTREPGGTRLGERIRDALLHAIDVDVSPRAEALAMFAARAQHLDEVIEPALARGQWVLCDRFTEATYAYQGAGRELGFDAIETLERWTQGERRPDLTLIFDVSGDIAKARMSGANRTPDRFERESDGFRDRVRQGYADIATRHPQRVRVIDASGTLEAVAALVHDALEQFLRANKP